jgi:flagellar capping protein FliD
MENAIFGDKMDVLREVGISTHDDYNKKGQLALDESKLIAALQNDSEKVYEVFAKGPDSMMDKMKSTIKNYVGSSSSIFAKKAGIEKTASAANNFYSEQLKKQAELIKTLQNKLSDKEEKLYLKFGSLESQMNKLNSQMNYFTQ